MRDNADVVHGLVVNGELRLVQWFRRTPLIWDFHLGYYIGGDEYDVVEVNPVIVGHVAPSE